MKWHLLARYMKVDRKAATFISCLNFKLLSWLLQHFGHIQSKNKDGNKNQKLLVSHPPPYGGYGIERVKGLLATEC